MDKRIIDLGASGTLLGTESFEIWQGGPESVTTDLNSISSFISSSLVPASVTRITQNITGLTTVNLTGTKGVVYVELISSNATESLKAFTGFSNVDVVYLKSKTIPSLDVTYDDLTTVTSGNFKLVTTPLTTIGSGEGIIKFFKVGSVFYQEFFIDQYV